MRRNVESLSSSSPVDAHERTRDYLSEAEFVTLLQGMLPSRYRWRNTAMLMLTFYHGLRAITTGVHAWPRGRTIASAGR